jgi:hypothetical protein
MPISKKSFVFVVLYLTKSVESFRQTISNNCGCVIFLD